MKTCYPIIPLCLAVALLAACTATPYRTPAMPVAAGYEPGTTAAEPRSAAARDSAQYAPRDVGEDPWWRGFGDPGLDRLVEDVLASNHDLASATLRIQKARLNAGLVANDALPRAAGSISGSETRSLASGSDSQRTYGADLSVGYEVDLWGRLRAQRDAARWQAEATAEDRDGTALVLVATTCRLYWSLAYLNRRIDSGEASLAKARRTLQLVQAQYRAGAVSALEIHEAEQALQAQATTQSQLLQQRVETRNAIAELRDGRAWPTTDEPRWAGRGRRAGDRCGPAGGPARPSAGPARRGMAPAAEPAQRRCNARCLLSEPEPDRRGGHQQCFAGRISCAIRSAASPRSCACRSWTGTRCGSTSRWPGPTTKSP